MRRVTRERTGVEPVAVLVPVKSFAAAKVRLADAVAPAERAALVKHMAETVVTAAGPMPVAVVCDDDEVAAWARALGAQVVWTPGTGLNGAVAAGVAELAATGVQRVIVAHADLPLARDLTWVGAFDGITIVPDRRQDGTNVLAVPADSRFAFAYGPGSFSRHLTTARRSGYAVRMARSAELAWDVDVPADLSYAP